MFVDCYFGKMVPSGPPTPIGGAQPVPPSLLRSNSGMLGAQAGPVPPQTGFPSLVSPRTQYNNVNLLGNVLSTNFFKVILKKKKKKKS